MNQVPFPTFSLTSKEKLNELLLYMVEAGGSDLFLMENLEVWSSIYGKKQKLTNKRIKLSEIESLLNEIYGVNATAILGSGSPIDMSYEFTKNIGDFKQERFRYRVNIVGCQRSGRKSYTVTFRTIPTTPPSTSQLGIEDQILDICDKADQGLILVVGATGNGKSTLLASILRGQLEKPDGHQNMITIESPIEFVYDDIEKPSSFITQLEVGRHIESFNAGVVNSLRMAPTTILVGESRDYETVKSSIEASVTGHVVYSTVHANSVSETLQRLIAVFPEDLQSQAKIDIIQSSNMIIAQRLLRTIDGKRTAIREYLYFDKSVKDKLMTSNNPALDVFECLEESGQPMMVDVEKKYKDGIISKEIYEKQKINYASIKNRMQQIG